MIGNSVSLEIAYHLLHMVLQIQYNDNFLKTEFMLPRIEEQIKLGEYFSNLDNLIALHQRKP